nr:MAG TPA: hypothetical protein [Caudoviricetes sp.]
MYKSNAYKKEALLDSLKSELREARRDLEDGTDRDKLDNIFFLENAIDSLEYEILNSDY